MAVEIRLSAAEVARVRLAVSPLAETVLGVRTALGVGGHGVHRAWVREARPVLAGEPELPLLRTLLEGCLPSFLLPVPEERLPVFDTELAGLRAADPVYVAAECAAALGARAGELPGAAVLLERVADALVRCYVRLVAPHWGRMRAVLEADLGKRALALVDGGVEGLFAQLHGDVVWRDGELVVHGRRRSGAQWTVETDGHGLVLMPSVFGWPDVIVDYSPRTTASIRYPASGVGLLWEQPRPTSAGLTAVLGRTRAALLAELGEPLSTPDLAARLGVTAGAVSQHLGALRGAGLVTTHRTGRTAVHLRTQTGTALTARPSD
ncbi:ArsR/SmtB family transcription factor [Streptacidiphilus albus]|uniref:ArsR/SmtB family transcription factor n=1 Tax=Streptacidiphilus albus TaxID=105425 RepID=UPI00068D59F0|nr:winged helix-turn-helix domain-containing protein [Streptacidiphilus albus]